MSTRTVVLRPRPLRRPLPRTRLGRGKVHRVYAAGGPRDGSLGSLATLCGLTITASWVETDAEATCLRCLRILPEEARDGHS